MLAINLSACAVEMGLTPKIICQDRQGTSILHHRAGNLPFEVLEDTPNKAPDADIVFFDHPASDWEVPQAKTLVMPVKPSRDQYATFADARKLAIAAGKDIIIVVTDPHMHRADEKATTEHLRKQEGAFVIPSSGVFSRAASEYRTIFDPALNKAYKVSQRRQEMRHILGRLLMQETTTDLRREKDDVAAA